MRAKRLQADFYTRHSIELSQDLIGKILVRKVGQKLLRARIVETEAYIGEHDLASHSSKGRTPRTEVMFGRAGFAYIYLVYGMYEMFNIVAGLEGDAQAVLIRAAEPLGQWNVDLSGPGKLARGFKISRKQNALNLSSSRELFLLDDGTSPQRVVASPRVGVDYAKEWKTALLRFYDPESKCVSAKRR